MSTAVTLLAAGAKNDGGSSTPLDVSAFTSLRLDAKLLCNHGKAPFVTLSIDTGQAAAGPFTQIFTKTFRSGSSGLEAWPASSVQRITLAGFDSFVRVRWQGAAGAASNNQSTDATGEFDIAVTGAAQ